MGKAKIEGIWKISISVVGIRGCPNQSTNSNAIPFQPEALFTLSKKRLFQWLGQYDPIVYINGSINEESGFGGLCFFKRKN